jgi:hypothetical protein
VAIMETRVSPASNRTLRGADEIAEAESPSRDGSGRGLEPPARLGYLV